MRRESSTVVMLVGPVRAELMAGLSRSPNISVVGGSAPAESANGTPAEHQDWEPGALAMREAARRRSTYVLVPDDPLAGVAAAWQAMWDVNTGPAGRGRRSRSRPPQALAAWQDKRFELPDYYLVIAPPGRAVAGPDLYLGPLRAARPHRVAVTRDHRADRTQAAGLLDTLRSLEHGPWWPPLDELLDGARRFYAGGLAESQPIRRTGLEIVACERRAPTVGHTGSAAPLTSPDSGWTR